MARFIALDWDQNALHVVAAEVKGTSVTVSKAAVWVEPRTPNPVEAEELGKLLRERLKEAGIQPAPVLACLGRDRLIVKDVRFPTVSEQDEPDIVRFQVSKELTDDRDVVIDYYKTGPGPAGDQKASALVIRREILETYKKLCESAGLKLQALTPRLVGIIAALRRVTGTTVVTPAPEPADGTVCTVVVAEKLAEQCIVRHKHFQQARAVPNGPTLLGEIRRNLAAHNGTPGRSPVVAVYVAGKGAAELRERLAESIDIPVHTFDPFAGAESVALPAGNRGTFAGAMGLLHLAGAGDLPINFASPRQAKPPVNPLKRFLPVGIAAAAAVVIGVFLIGRVLHAAVTDELDSVKAEIAAIEAKTAGVKANAKRLKAIEEWDTPVAVDELYELNALNPDVNALRITSITAEPVARNAKTKAAGKITVKGKLLDKVNGRKPLDTLVESVKETKFYSPEAPKVEGDVFTWVVYPDRRAPELYKAELKEPAAKPGRGGSSKTGGKTKEPDKSKEMEKAKDKSEGADPDGKAKDDKAKDKDDAKEKGKEKAEAEEGDDGAGEGR